MKRWISISTFALGMVGLGCQSETALEELGELSARLTVTASAHDVESVHFKVVSIDSDCSGPALSEVTVALESEALPANVAPIGTGPQHRFSDSLVALAPGDYRVCVTPTTASGEPSAICSSGEAEASVFEGQTTEVLVVSQCDGTGNGALDTIAVLNDPPVIDAIDLEESKFILDCESVELSATASDPNGDAVSFSYLVVAAPPSATFQLTQSGDVATFTPDGAGDYQVEIRATDVLGGTSAITVPIHVSEGDDAECGPNLSDMPQFYCNGTCGNWGGGNDCQQEDADVYCRLLTGNPTAVATSFTITTALDAPGICCPPPTLAPGSLGCVDLGVLSVSGTPLNVSIHPTSVLSTHGPGNVITNAVCAIPE